MRMSEANGSVIQHGPHIILLGDSIFDNLAYVRPGPDVITQLREVVPAGWRVSLYAVDGSITDDVVGQLADLPTDATHLVLSVGGNDLLGYREALLHTRVTVSSEVFRMVARIVGAFESRYRRAVEASLQTGLPLVVCTIYNGAFDDEEFRAMAQVAVALFNDVILRISREKSLPAIDLRLVCTQAQDYANPIEPSSIGGEKIANAILRTISLNLEEIHEAASLSPTA